MLLNFTLKKNFQGEVRSMVGEKSQVEKLNRAEGKCQELLVIVEVRNFLLLFFL